jgi:zinc transporter ZupT
VVKGVKRMVFTVFLGVIGAVYSVLYVAGFPSALDFFSGFILGGIIDIYILLKDKKGRELH